MDTAPALPLPAPRCRRRRLALSGVAAALLTIAWSSAAAAEPPKAAGPQQSAPPAEAAGVPTRSLDSIAPLADDGSMQRIIAVVTGSVGVAGIAVGSVFGGLAIVRWNQVKSSLGSCADKANYSGCPEQVKNVQLEATAFATVSTYSILTGMAAIGGAIAVWYTSPRLPKAQARLQFTPVVSPEGAAGVVMGVF